jgi:hypothetical protein
MKILFIFYIFIILLAILIPKNKEYKIKIGEKFNIQYDNLKDIDKSYDYYNAYNSSISKENGNYVVYSRISNWSCKNKGKATKEGIKNLLGITVLDKDFNIISKNVINPEDPFFSLEDVRVFFWNGKKFFIGSRYIYNDHIKRPNIFFPILLTSTLERIDILDENGKNYYNNKNFVPIILENELYLIKNHNPFEILKCLYVEDEKKLYCKEIISGEYDISIPNLRGNTPYIELENNRFMAITHETIEDRAKQRTYLHYFTIINFEDKDKPFIESISKPFCLLGNCGIEFVMGFIESYDGQSYIITLGKNDCTSHIVKISKKDTMNHFNNFNNFGK